MEWRARLEMEFAAKLAKHAEKYRAILSVDPYLPLQSTFVTSLERTQEYADQLIQSQVRLNGYTTVWHLLNLMNPQS